MCRRGRARYLQGFVIAPEEGRLVEALFGLAYISSTATVAATGTKSISSVFRCKVAMYIVLKPSKNLFTTECSDNANDKWWNGGADTQNDLFILSDIRTEHELKNDGHPDKFPFVRFYYPHQIQIFD